jgi:hypothetical protein
MKEAEIGGGWWGSWLEANLGKKLDTNNTHLLISP